MRGARLTRREVMTLGAGALGAAALVPTMRKIAWAQARSGSAEPKRGGLLRLGQEVDPISLDPHTTANFSANSANEHIYESLTAYDRSMNVVPSLAVRWETPNPTTYVFHLRPGVRWHDGKPFVAEDVKYSIERVLDPKTAAVQAQNFRPIAKVDVVNDATVRITTQDPYPGMLGAFAALRGGAILQRGAAERMNLAIQAIGTGPFKLKEFVPDSHVVYERHREYWGEPLPYLTGMLFKTMTDEETRIAALRSGAVDYALVSAEGAKRVATAPNVRVLESPKADLIWFLFNLRRRPFDDVRVRQAMNLALDRQEFIDKVEGGAGVLTGPIATGYSDWFVPPKELPWRTDLNRARQLLAEAGFPNGFRTTLKVAHFRESGAAGVVFAEQMKRIGVDVQIVQREWGQLLREIALPAADFDIFWSGIAFRHDPDGYFSFYFTSNGVWNFGYGTAEMDALLREARTDTNHRRRVEKYRAIQRKLMNDVPNLWIYVRKNFEGIQESVRGYTPLFSYYRIFLKETWLDK